LLELIGLPFTTIPSTLSEPPIAGEEPVQYARTLAQQKALDIAEKNPHALVLGADTIVLIDGKVLGKPAGSDEALHMLTLLSGKTHDVITAYSFIHLQLQIVENYHISTKVHFRELRKSEMLQYIETGAPFDKAGAYGIQDYSAIFVDKVEGCFYNVVGLPISDLYSKLTHILQSNNITLK